MKHPYLKTLACGAVAAAMAAPFCSPASAASVTVTDETAQDIANGVDYRWLSRLEDAKEIDESLFLNNDYVLFDGELNFNHEFEDDGWRVTFSQEVMLRIFGLLPDSTVESVEDMELVLNPFEGGGDTDWGPALVECHDCWDGMSGLATADVYSGTLQPGTYFIGVGGLFINPQEYQFRISASSTAIPLPPAVWGMGAGLGLFAAFGASRRRRAKG